MNRGKEAFLLAFLVIAFISINYHFLDSFVVKFLDESSTAKVERIIDGDTIVVENDTHIRLLGINTPEKKEKYYEEAKDFLSDLILNKTIKLEFGSERTDLYGRTLAYVFFNEKNVNIELVREGLANVYVVDKDKYINDLRNAWNSCIASNKNLCEKSNDKCSNCIKLKELDAEKQTATFNNNCDFSCDLTSWTIKDEGRKKFVFPNFLLDANKKVSIIVAESGVNTNSILYWIRKDYVWTEEGDTLFLRDEEGKLVVWKGY